ncbi:hypothetical protein EVA_08367 [gut metagenome]|uniref:Uncharacterized protein n=1 Tax=gut metagenome TaxID=749906 RepID=J9G8I0_9ZZZZ
MASPLNIAMRRKPPRKSGLNRSARSLYWRLWIFSRLFS